MFDKELEKARETAEKWSISYLSSNIQTKTADKKGA